MKRIWPGNVSESFIKANPYLAAKVSSEAIYKQLTGNVECLKAKRGVMNKTESEFALMLEAQKRAGEIMDYWFEGMTLRWSGISYTPDFTLIRPTMQLGFIEIKGAFTGGKFERAVERFRHARTFWTYFDFELHKKTKDGWKRIY